MEIQPLQPLELSIDQPQAPKTQGNDFKDLINKGISELNQSLKQSDELQQRYAAGEDISLHEVMISAQEAGIASRLAVSLRNQALDAYREIIRMQI